MQYEYHVLNELKCDIIVYHSYDELDEALKDAGINDTCREKAWYILPALDTRLPS